MRIHKSLKTMISMSLIFLLTISTAISPFAVFASDASDSTIIEGYKMISAPVAITAPTYSASDPWSTFVNSATITSSYGVIYKIDFPDMAGKEFKNFIFRFGTIFYGGNNLRVMGVPANTDVPNMSYKDEPFSSMWANESAYTINAGNIACDNFHENYYMNYADITAYANECLGKGNTYMYIALNSSSSAKAFGSNIKDTDYRGYDLFPYYYYDTKSTTPINTTPTIKGYQEISDPVLITSPAYAPGDPWKPFTNSTSVSESMGVIYRVDLPSMNGKEFKNFIFRFGSSYYGGKSMRIMGVPANTKVPDMAYTDEPFKSMWANERDYTINTGDILYDNFKNNYYINYADITSYANDCLAQGDTYMYLAVNASSTGKVFSSDIKDSDYIKYDMFPYFYYDTKPITPSSNNILANINNRISSGQMTHPYIHGSLEKIDEIIKNISSGDYWTIYLYQKTKAAADALAAESPKSYGTEVSQSYSGVSENILTLMTTYHIEGENKYLERALAEFEMLQEVNDWTAAAQLDNTQTGVAVAISYDWLYDYLSDEQKLWAETVLKEKVLSIAYRYYQNPNNLSQIRKENDNMNIVCGRGTYNHNTHNNSDLALCALAIAPKDPAYSAFIISNNLYNIEPYLELVGTNGGHEEPIGYYNYTSLKIVSMMSALNTSLGTMYGYENYPGFATTSYYPMQMYGAGPFCFGDTGRGKGVFNSNPLYFFAKYSNDIPLMGVLASRFEYGSCASVLLWYEKSDLDNADTNERLPLDAHLYPTSHGQNIVAFRDNWNIDKGFYAAMYTGCASANGHSDAVSGAFCIDAYGERFATPMGLGDYKYTDYWDHSQNGGRWTWYEKRPEGGNCLVINPSEDVGQRVDETAVFDRFETSEGTSFAVTDLTNVYADYVTHYKRGMKVHKNRSRIVVQDEAIMKTPSKIFWSFNTEAAIEIVDNNTVILTNNDKKVMVKISCNTNFSLFKMKAEKLPTSPQNDLQRQYPGYSKVAVTAENVSQLMLSAEFTPLSNRYEWEDDTYVPVSIDQWAVSENFEAKPVVKNILIGNKAVEGFESDKYNYDVVYDEIPDVIPPVTVDNPNGYDISVTYPTNGKTEIIVKVKGDTRTAYYVLNLIQTKSNQQTFTAVFDYSKMTTASYDPLNPETTGSNESTNYLFATKKFKPHYVTLDISNLKNTDVISAVYKFYTAGVINLSIYEVSGDFIPGTTPFSQLPEAGASLGEISDGSKGRHSEIDITEYIRRLLSEGKTSAGIMVVQNSESTAWIAGTVSSSYARPQLTVNYRKYVEPLVISNISTSSSGGKKSGSVTITNNSSECFGEYIFFGAAYNGDKLIDVSVSETFIVMPYRTKTITASVTSLADTGFFLWKTNGEPVKTNHIR